MKPKSFCKAKETINKTKRHPSEWAAFLLCWLCLLMHKSFKDSCTPVCLFLLLLPVLFVSYPRNHCQNPMSGRFPPMLSSKSFIVSSLTFRSLIHFEFIFVYGGRECSNFILLHVAVQFSQHHLLKRLSFLHCIFLPPLS